MIKEIFFVGNLVFDMYYVFCILLWDLLCCDNEVFFCVFSICIKSRNFKISWGDVNFDGV